MKKILPLAFAALAIVPAGRALAVGSPVIGAHRFSSGVRFHGGFRGGFHSRIYVSPGWWGWGWGWGWYGPYAPYYYGYSPGYYGYEGYGGARPQFARLKTDVSPEEARVYLDGQYIGMADDFDGWPDYLYLGRGHYRLEFRLSGYESQTVEVDSRPGTTLKIDNKLRKAPGASRYGSFQDAPKIENVQRFWVKHRDRAEAAGPGAPGYGAPRDRDRYSRESPADRDRDDDGDYDVDAAPEVDRQERPAPPAPAREDSWRDSRRPSDSSVRGRPGAADRTRLRLKVEPADAAVYLDDRFIGTAEEVNSLDRGVTVSPGKHVLTISRPGYRDVSRDIDVKAGDNPTLELSLER